MQNITKTKGRLRVAIFESAETVHLILLCLLGDALRCAVSADLKMAADNRPLPKTVCSFFKKWIPNAFIFILIFKEQCMICI